MNNALPQTLNQRLIRKIVTLSHPLIPEPITVVPSLKMLAGIKAVLFDVYGTMLVVAPGDSRSDFGCHQQDHFHAALHSAAFSPLASEASSRGIEWLGRFITEAQKIRQREGVEYPEVDIREIWKKVLEALGEREWIHGSISDEAIACMAVEYECRVNPVWPMPSLRDTLDHLAASGQKLGIVSNAQFYTPLTLSAFPQTGWKDGRFDESLCMWSYMFREAKPSTRLLRFALQELDVRYGIQPPEVLCIGNDLLKDILPAKQVGCRTAFFAGNRSYRSEKSNPALLSVTPDLVIVDLKQICDVVSRSP